MKWGNFKSHTNIEGEGVDGYAIDIAQRVEAITTETPVPREEAFYPTTIFPIGISHGESEKIIPLEEVGREYLLTRDNPN